MIGLECRDPGLDLFEHEAVLLGSVRPELLRAFAVAGSFQRLQDRHQAGDPSIRRRVHGLERSHLRLGPCRLLDHRQRKRRQRVDVVRKGGHGIFHGLKTTTKSTKTHVFPMNWMRRCPSSNALRATYCGIWSKTTTGSTGSRPQNPMEGDHLVRRATGPIGHGG